ncbi:MAG: hypothetical protein N2260_07815 [Syntrophobacterales bacterium]|nr:hypothetical protein [Syntrophobacterales bacterium]
MKGKVKPLAWLLASVGKELEPLTEFGNVINSFPFYGQYVWEMVDSEGRTFLLVTTGIGKANAAFTVGALGEISERPSIIVNLGIAGVYSHVPPMIGDVVIITRCVMGDEGVWEGGDRFLSYEAIGISPIESTEEALYGYISLENSPFLEQVRRFFPEGCYSLEDLLFFQDAANKGLIRPFNLWYGSSCSVGLASGSPQIASMRQRIYGTWIEEMEVSAFLLASLRLGVPVLALRGISNQAGDRDRLRWDMERSIYNVCAVTMRILDKKVIR